MEFGNGILRLVFDDATGSLTQITDLGLGYDFLADPRGHRLIKLVVSTDTVGSAAVCSHESGKPLMVKRGDTLSIRFPHLVENGRETGIEVEVTVHLPAGSWEAFFTVDVVNHGSAVIHEVHFPWVGGWTGIAGKGHDTITVSSTRLDPYTFPTQRAHSFGRHHMRRFIPFHAVQAPFCDISGGGRGISYNLYSSTPRLAGFVVDDLSPNYDEVCLSWAWVSYPYLKSGDRWRSRTVGIGVHRGDWHVSADRLRESMRGWWKAPAIPSHLRESIGYFNIQFTGHDGEFHHGFAEIPAILDDCKTHGVSDLCVWDQQGQIYVRHLADNAHWQLPADRENTLREALAKARDRGGNVGAWIDFAYLTERSRVYPGMENDILLSFYGKPVTHPYSGVGQQHARFLDENLNQGPRILCQRSPRFHAFALDLVRQTLDLGFQSIFIDGGTEWRLCHAGNHGHESPDDTIEGAFDWMAEATRLVRERNADGYLIGESPESYNSQVIDLFTTWWQPGAHTETLQYVWPEMLIAWGVDENDRDVIPEIFAKNQLLALMTTDLDRYLSEEPELASHVARLAKLRGDTKDFVASGTFRDDLGLEVEGGLGYLFTSAKGLAVALGNKESDPQTIRFTLCPEAVGQVPVSHGRLYVEGERAAQAITEDRDGQLELQVSLPAFGSAVWCAAHGEQ